MRPTFSSEATIAQRPAPRDLDACANFVGERFVAAMHKAGYVVGQRIGCGGMGQVFAAAQRSVGRAVAIKTLHPHLTDNVAISTRFRQEGRITAGIRSPHVVEVFDGGTTPSGAPYIVMELLEGETAEARLRRTGAFSWCEAVCVGVAIANSLVHAHAFGALHRDVTPSNVYLTRRPTRTDGGVKLIDFGVAKVARAGLAITQPGLALGSLRFMAPEQATDPHAADERADVFGLGATLQMLVTNAPPFDRTPYAGLVPQRRKSVAWKPLDRVLERCLRWEPAERIGSAAEVSAELSALAFALGIDSAGGRTVREPCANRVR